MTPDSSPDLLCAAIWNGCRCARRPHKGNGHVWRNTLDGDLVDPALYPALAAPEAGGLDAERLARALREVDGERPDIEVFPGGAAAYTLAGAEALLTAPEAGETPEAAYQRGYEKGHEDGCNDCHD